MIYILGDTHIRKEEPYFSAVKNIFEDLYSVMKDGDTLIQLGDFFHTYKPFPKEYSLAFNWLEKISAKGIKTYIMAGNNAHEYHHLQKSYAISPLESIGNVFLIKDASVLTINGFNFCFLPWMPDSAVQSLGYESFSDYMANLSLEEKSVEPEALVGVLSFPNARFTSESTSSSFFTTPANQSR